MKNNNLLIVFFIAIASGAGYAQVKHSVFLGSGYALSLKNGDAQDFTGREEVIDPVTNFVEYKDVRNRLAEGYLWQLGYQIDFKEKWLVSVSSFYNPGVSYSRILSYDRNTGLGGIKFTSRARSYGINLTGGYYLLPLKPYRNQNFLNNFSIATKIGANYFQSTLFEEDESPEGRDYFLYFLAKSQKSGGYGLGLNIGFTFLYRLDEAVSLGLNLRAEYARFHPDFIRRTYNEDQFGIDRSIRIVNMELQPLDYNNVHFNFSINYHIN